MFKQLTNMGNIYQQLKKKKTQINQLHICTNKLECLIRFFQLKKYIYYMACGFWSEYIKLKIKTEIKLIIGWKIKCGNIKNPLITST